MPELVSEDGHISVLVREDIDGMTTIIGIVLDNIAGTNIKLWNVPETTISTT